MSFQVTLLCDNESCVGTRGKNKFHVRAERARMAWALDTIELGAINGGWTVKDGEWRCPDCIEYWDGGRR